MQETNINNTVFRLCNTLPVISNPSFSPIPSRETKNILETTLATSDIKY